MRAFLILRAFKGGSASCVSVWLWLDTDDYAACYVSSETHWGGALSCRSLHMCNASRVRRKHGGMADG